MASPKGSSSALPQIARINENTPIIVLPHAEPLTEEQKAGQQHLINLLSLEIVTCFLSQSWANRQAALEKIMEQLNNLDPAKRDAMGCEINKFNTQLEDSLPVLCEFFKEALKDPVLKIYLSTLQLM